jgi:N-glycosylase/DNA lyase
VLEPSPYPRTDKYPLLNPEISINSGQMFLWEKYDNSWYGIYGEHILKVSNSSPASHIGDNRSDINKSKRDIEFLSFPEIKSWERHIFRLDDNIKEILSSFSNDALVSESIRKYPGLRLMRQEPHQCMISFVCASNTNMFMIRRMLKNLSRKYGNKVIVDGREFFTFPCAERLNKATDLELRLCGLGYRTKAVKALTESIVNSNIDIKYLLSINYDDAKQELLKVYGVGNKVADCILLFCLDKLDAFPIDIWITRVLYWHYSWLFSKDKKKERQRKRRERIDEKITFNEYKILSKNIRNYFGKYCGYAQQYLFYNIRETAGKKW